MAIVLYILAFIFLLILLVLISPVRLTIDTISNTYSLSWKGVIKAMIISVNQEPTVSLQMFAFKKDFNILKASTKKSKKKKKKNEKSKSKERKKMTVNKMKRLMKTFTIKSFYVNVDFNDYFLNGYLIPLFYFLKSQNRNLNINYYGHNEIKLIVENRPYKLIKAYLF